MRILKLVDYKFIPVEPVVYTNKRNDSKYYNLIHGTKGVSTWKWSCSLDINYFTVNDQPFTMDGDDYVLIPIRGVGGSIKKDIKGNAYYMLSKDNTYTHRKDILLLWEIPNKNYSDVKYTIVGDSEVLGSGCNGRIRGEKRYLSPAPIIEIFGDTTLTWSGVDTSGRTHSQTITYTRASDNWDINKINIQGVDDGCDKSRQ